MDALADLIERCAAAAIGVQTDDLPALARLHTNFQLVGAAAGDPPVAPVRDGAARAAVLLERLILNEVQDAAAALADVCGIVHDLQAACAVPAGSPAAPVPSLTPPDVAAPAAPPAIDFGDEQAVAAADAPLTLEFVGEALGHLETAEASLLKLDDEPDDADLVNAVFRAFHTIKGVAGFLNLRQIGALAHAAETLLDLARKGAVPLDGGRMDVVLEALDLMKQMVAAVETAAAAAAAPPRQPGLAAVMARLDAAARADDVAPVAPQPGADIAAITPVETSIAATAHAAGAAPPGGAPSSPSPSAGSAGDANVKVATGRLDALIDMVGELVIAQSMVAQDVTAAGLTSDPRLGRNLSQLGKITRTLQELSMSMRMVPVHGVFQKMARLVRDVARKAGKDVEFEQAGGETELDRNVVEAIGDPLVHMVRNAVDHGIEFPDDRRRAGKPPAGRIALKAYHQAGSVVIEIADDGRGLNKARILEKAVAAGIVTSDGPLEEQDVFRLIFHPGLSTAEQVTALSGRGVGMDVVKRNVEALRGRIEIASTPGTGSVFTIRLPLTLAVIDGLVVKVGAERYIVPITGIEQSLRPTPGQLATVQERGELCRVRDRLLPVVRLHRLFGVAPRTDDPTQSLVVVIQDGARRCCLLVDELLGQQQVVIKSLGLGVGAVPGVAGCAILGEGNVSLILDVAGIMQAARAA